MSQAAPNRVPAATNSDDTVFEHAQGAPDQGNQNGAAQHGTNGSQANNSGQAGQNLVPEWPYGEGDVNDQPDALENTPQGPGFRTLVGNTFTPLRHHAGAAVSALVGDAGTRYQRHLEERRAEREAARRETLGRWAAQGLVARWQGFNNRREALAAGLRDIRQRWAAHRIENALNREHRRGNVHIDWDSLSGTSSTTANGRAPERQDGDRQPTSMREIERDSRSPIRPQAQRQAGRDERRRAPQSDESHDHTDSAQQRVTSLRHIERDPRVPFSTAKQRADGRRARRGGRTASADQPNEQQREVRLNPAAIAYAQWEFNNQLTQAERDSTNEQQWVANRAAVLPDTELGRITVARMAREMSGAPQHELEVAAWNELMAEPRLLPSGVSPEQWVAARQRVHAANVPGAKRAPSAEDESIAGHSHVTRIHGAAQAERERYAAQRREEIRHNALVYAVEQPFYNSMHRQLGRAHVDFSKFQGNGVLTVQRVARGTFGRVLAERMQHESPDALSRLDPEGRTNAESHIVDAITFAMIENGLVGPRAKNINDAQRNINTEAMVRSIHRVLDQLVAQAR